MHMKHGTHFVTCGRGGKFVFGEVLSWWKIERLLICAFLNVKVHGEFTMLSPMKPGKKFDTISDTFVFHRVSRHLL